jgi:iron complex outermembrane receptor protein
MKKIKLLSVLISASALGIDVHAQDNTTEEILGTLEEIVVTAQRREESLQDTAVAINVLGDDKLIETGIASPDDLSLQVPALTLAAGAGGGTQVVIRGVGNFIGNPYGEPAVAMNVDDVYIARSSGTQGLFFDLQRVEVLKGPQGTLYGRNATAGAINVIPKRPDLEEFSLEGNLELGDYDTRRATLAVNTPISDTVAFRLAGTYSKHDGYLDDGYNDEDTKAARAQVLFEPSDNLSVRISADYAESAGQGQAGVASPYLTDDPFTGPTQDGFNNILQGASLSITGGANPNLLLPIDDEGFLDNSHWGLSGHVNYEFETASLTVISSFRNTENNYRHFGAGFPLTSIEESDATSLEVRLSSNNSDSNLEWLLGAYYFDEEIAFDLNTNQGVTFGRTNPELETQSLAAFGQLTYSLSDLLRLSAGLRYTTEEKSQIGRQGGPTPPVPVGFPGPDEAFFNIACAPYEASTGTCFAPLAGDLDDDSVTWKVGFEYDLADDSLLYANVATGFKAGGFFPSLPPNTFKPEELTAYTIGSKNRLLDNTLQLNIEAFFWEYDDKQVTHIGPVLPGGFNLITENAGGADVLGFEVETIWAPTDSDNFYANLQYLDTEYTEFNYTQTTVTGVPQTTCPTTPVPGQPAVVVNCTGKELPLSAEWILNLGYGHTFVLNNGSTLSANIDSRLQTSYFVGEEYLPGQVQDDFTSTSVRVTWSSADEKYKLTAYVDNIEDEDIKASAFVQPVVGIPLVTFRPPRTYGVRLSFEL